MTKTTSNPRCRYCAAIIPAETLGQSGAVAASWSGPVVYWFCNEACRANWLQAGQNDSSAVHEADDWDWSAVHENDDGYD